MKRVIISERQYNLGNKRLAESLALTELKSTIETMKSMKAKVKFKEWAEVIFRLGQLYDRIDLNDIFARDEIMHEYDSIVKKVDDLTEI
jgi:hypothetical protein